MARKLQIGVVFLVAILLLAAVGAYAWDSTRNDKIAEGITIGGVDVGGMTADEARQTVDKELVAPLRRIGLRLPAEMEHLLRFGRGVDNRHFKATGFRYGFTSRETVIRLGEHLRLARVLRSRPGDDTYHYEREVEEFLRWSPHVRRERDGEGVAADSEPLGI